MLQSKEASVPLFPLALALSVFGHNTFRNADHTERHQLWKQSHCKGVLGKMTGVQTSA